MSPHGSKLWEFTKFLANRLIPDGVRRRLKTFGAAVQRVPLKILGVDSQFERQRAEIERLKSRLVSLDGKFNLALYGVPRLDEYRASLLASPLLFELPPPRPSAAPTPPPLELEGKTPASILFLGLNAPIDGIAPAGAASAIDPDRERLEAFRKAFPKADAALATDLLSGLIALADRRFDLILCLNVLHQLAPREQSQVLALAQERLSPGGMLVLDLPDLTKSEISGDLYWADERNLRPYSRQLILDVLKAKDGATDAKSIGG